MHNGTGQLVRALCTHIRRLFLSFGWPVCADRISNCPVRADRPAKRQKKTSCVSTGRLVPVLCTRQMAPPTSFLSRQSDVIAFFLFGAKLCTQNIFTIRIFFSYCHYFEYFFSLLYLTNIRHITSSPGQCRGNCGHVMASFDSPTHCARCKGKGKKDFFVENPQSSDCQICKSFTPEQCQQLAIPSYKIKKEKGEAKKLDSSPPPPPKRRVRHLSNLLLLSPHLIRKLKKSLPLLLNLPSHLRPKLVLNLRSKMQNWIKSGQIVSTA